MNGSGVARTNGQNGCWIPAQRRFGGRTSNPRLLVELQPIERQAQIIRKPATPLHLPTV